MGKHPIKLLHYDLRYWFHIEEVYHLLFACYTPRFNEVDRGVYWYHPVRLRTQITLYEEDKNYPIWRRQERRSKYAVQLASWQLRSNSPKMSVRPSVRPSVRLSVCGQNRVSSVSSRILIGSISYLHILSSNFRRCVACDAHFKIKKFEILAIF